MSRMLLIVIKILVVSVILVLIGYFMVKKLRSQNYIFGYGSLISAESRSRTGITGKSFPVRVSGLRRMWDQRRQEYGVTVLGAVQDEQATCNGVLFEVSPDELAKFDEREGGYYRIKLDHEKIQPLTQDSVPTGDIWVYVSHTSGTASDDCPIIQSYVDVVLTGCLELDKQFAEEFITTTGGWQHSWINDREKPKYVRAMKQVPQALEIDSMLLDALKRKTKF